MADSRDKYENPLISRYASKEMSYIFSPQKKFSTWRRLWHSLASAEKELGLPITDEQLNEMKAHFDDIDFALAEAKEKELRHDVMSHIHAFGVACPTAKPIIHLGATSCYVGDNTDLICLKEGLELLRSKLVNVLKLMSDFSDKHKDLPTLGFTHLQPAQLTTVGKRCTLWMQDLLMDLDNVQTRLDKLQYEFRGVKGTTGTQASFLELFEGDHAKVRKLNERVTQLSGFTKAIPVSGQTYSRKVDFLVASVLSGIAQSTHKMATDIRLLMHMKEIEEPFEKSQVGSSAMAYKRNPMRSERICSIARYVMSLLDNTAQTHATQWMERTLDDSANRRLSLPEAFLGVDICLSITANVVDGLHVWPLVIRKHLDAELPFMATENIMMACVKAGGDRGDLHEAIREHSMAAGRRVKEEGADNDLLDRIRKDPLFAAVANDLDKIMDARLFVGRAPEQVTEFLEEEVKPMLSKYDVTAMNVDLNV
eukprot:GFYU01001615.1.p1 GENE.GFYU01001615.1~~GFYU01001615.1.p1  ORF type:complete len:481 (+),score=181.39 GFYU01001615.1:141-1583(+)